VIRFENCIGCRLSGSGLLHGAGIRDQWYYRFDNGTLPYQRPFYIKVLNCQDFKIQGSLTILNSPMWTVTLLNVHDGEIQGLNITSNYYVHPDTGELREPHNTDGIDVCEGSSDIWIHDVWIRNGDDSVVVKAGAVVNLTIGARWSSSKPCTRNVLVEDSHFELGHGCSIGSLASGCIENVMFRNITMANIGGCRVKTYPTNDEGGGGYIRNITFTDVVMDNTHDCIYVNGYYNKNAPANPKHFVNVSGLTFSKLRGSNCGRNPAYFVCQPETPCTDIVLDDLMLTVGEGNRKYPMQCENAVESSTGSTNGTVILPSSCLSPPLTPKQESGFGGGRVGVVVVVVLLTIVLCGEQFMNRQGRAVGQVRYLEMAPSISTPSTVTSDDGLQEDRGQDKMQTYTIT
jgi:hypothetical protein